MKKLLLFILLLVSISSFARLGETLKQCRTRYGREALSDTPRKIYFFRKKNFSIMLMFLPKSNKCNYIAYVKPNGKMTKTRKIKSIDDIINLFYPEKNQADTFVISLTESNALKKIYSTLDEWIKLGEIETIKGEIYFYKNPTAIILFDKKYLEYEKAIMKQQKASMQGL